MDKDNCYSSNRKRKSNLNINLAQMNNRLHSDSSRVSFHNTQSSQPIPKMISKKHKPDQELIDFLINEKLSADSKVHSKTNTDDEEFISLLKSIQGLKLKETEIDKDGRKYISIVAEDHGAF